MPVFSQEFSDFPKNAISLPLSEVVEHHEKQKTPFPADEDRASIAFAVCKGAGC